MQEVRSLIYFDVARNQERLWGGNHSELDDAGIRARMPMAIDFTGQIAPARTVEREDPSRRLDVDKRLKRAYERLPAPDIMNV